MGSHLNSGVSLYVLVVTSSSSWSISEDLRSLSLAILPHVFLFLRSRRSSVVDQMSDGHDRMVPDHARTSIAHDFFDLLAHLGFITVDRAVLAGGFFKSERTFSETFIGVIP